MRIPLPADPEDMNDDRSEWAAEALSAFQRVTGTEDEDALGDLLCDLMHSCDRNRLRAVISNPHSSRGDRPFRRSHRLSALFRGSPITTGSGTLTAAACCQ